MLLFELGRLFESIKTKRIIVATGDGFGKALESIANYWNLSIEVVNSLQDLQNALE
jgi:hypothetical protein